MLLAIGERGSGRPVNLLAIGEQDEGGGTPGPSYGSLREQRAEPPGGASHRTPCSPGER